MKVRFIKAPDGVKIAYEVAGTGSPALVFVHGWTCNRSHWRAQVAHFSASHTTVAIDLGGHGESDLGRQRWTMEAFGSDVVAVMKAEKLQAAILIGHSMGGRVIMEAARQAPDVVIGIVGADTYKSPPTAQSQKEWVDRLHGLEHDYRTAARKGIAAMFTPGADLRLSSEITDSMLKTPPAVGIGAVADIAATDHWLGTLKTLAVPKFVINSDFTPMDANAANEAGVDVTMMSGVGHFVMMEDPETFNRHLDAAISKIVG